MSDVTNSKGDVIAVSTTAVEERIAPVPTNGTNQEYANTLHIWNTGATDVRVGINQVLADFTVATAGLIPSGEDQYFVSGRKPIKSFVVATESGTSEVKYTAF
jgi:hypothetical protein